LSVKLTLPVAAAGETLATTVRVPWLGEVTPPEGIAIVVAIGTGTAVFGDVDG